MIHLAGTRATEVPVTCEALSYVFYQFKTNHLLCGDVGF